MDRGFGHLDRARGRRRARRRVGPRARGSPPTVAWGVGDVRLGRLGPARRHAAPRQPDRLAAARERRRPRGGGIRRELCALRPCSVTRARCRAPRGPSSSSTAPGRSIFAGVTAIGWLFPDGRLPSPRWRPWALAAALSFAGLVVCTVLEADAVQRPVRRGAPAAPPTCPTASSACRWRSARSARSAPSSAQPRPCEPGSGARQVSSGSSCGGSPTPPRSSPSRWRSACWRWPSPATTGRSRWCSGSSR